MRRVCVVFLLVLAATVCLGANPAQADDQWCFPQTNHCVSGKFLTYWQTHGGLPVFGYPITDAQNEVDPETGKTFLTQWFERNRFELHPENAGTPYEVLLGLLGKDLRREALIADPDFQRTNQIIDPDAPVPDNQWFFQETGHNLRFRFRQYWAENGGLARFGFPISEEQLEVDPETGKAFTVQWFERARFEYHPENQKPYDVLLGLLGNQIKKPKPGPDYVLKMGRDPYQINYPQGVAYGWGSSVYVADSGNHRIQKYTPTGQLINQWGSKGSGPGQMGDLNPNSLTAAYSRVCVSDITNHRVQVFDNAGNFIETITLPDIGTGFANDPRAIAIGGTGPANLTLYVLDSAERILTYPLLNSNPQPHVWKTYNNVLALATDASGGLYVGNGATMRVEHFDAYGNPVAGWGNGGSAGGLIGEIDGMALDSNKNVYVLDNRSHQVQVFNSNGQFVQAWGNFGTNDDQLAAPSAIAVDATNVYISDANGGRVQVFNHNGQFLGRWSSYGTELDRFKNPTGAALDGQGHLYIADSGNHTIKKFDTSGRLLSAWGGYGSAPGKFAYPNGVAVDKQGNVYVADTINQRVQKFDPNGTLMAYWGSYGTGNGQFDSPVGIAVDPQGMVYVVEEYNRRVQEFDGNGNFVRTWGRFGGGPGFFATPWGVAANAQSQIYVSDPGNPSVQKFDNTGHYLTSWVAPTIGVAVDPQGNVYTSGLEIHKYDGNGNQILKWGGLGYANGLFSDAHGLAVDAQGYVYVADTRNHRIQKFHLH